MKRIGLLSDTHAYIDDYVIKHFDQCDEIWHAGDIGSLEVIRFLRNFKPLKAVFGNIDSHEIRKEFPENLIFHCEGVKVFMTHIAGYPKKYNKRVTHLIEKEKPRLVICGHSHILKVLYDKKWEHLHMNPGAYGKQGFHKVRTMLRFIIEGKEIKDLEVIELGKR